MTNRRGFSMIELLMASGLTAFALAAIAQGLYGIFNTNRDFTEKREEESQMVHALQDVLRVGRSAQWCVRVVDDNTHVWLECQVDRNSPPTPDPSDDSLYRFGLTESGFQWLENRNNVFVPIVTYKLITQFEVCDDERMSTNACTLGRAISQQHTANLAAATFQSESDRFFRVQLGVPDEEKPTRTLQSAFYVRHPNPEGVLYGWGQWDE